MIKVIAAEPNDADSIKPREVHGKIDRATARKAIQEAPAVTFVYDTEVLAIFGLHEFYPGSAEIWALIGEDANKYPIAFGRKAKEMLERFVKTHKLRRLQMVVRIGFDDALKFAEFLDFQTEGVMRKYGPEGDDYYMMARIF